MPSIIIESLGMIFVVVLTWFGLRQAATNAVLKAQTATGSAAGEAIRSVADIQSWTTNAFLLFTAGMALLIMARVWSARRGHGNVSAPFVLPGACAAAGMGLCIQMGYGSPVSRGFWPGPDFALGFGVAAVVAAILIALPRDPTELFAPIQPLIPFVIVGTFVALRLFGSGTEESADTRINLFGLQPVEIAKLLFVIYFAQYLGRRAAKLRHQRDIIFGLPFPRRTLLIPATAVLLICFGAFVAINDLGPTMILSVVFLALFYIATRAGGWVVFAIVLVAGMVWTAAHVPAITHSPKVSLRLQMWLDPWTNGLPFGDQTARGLWAMASGHVAGRGVGAAPATALPAGYTDLAIAHLTEELGFVGLLVYTLAILAIAGQGLWIASMNRTPERQMLAAGLSMLLITQWAVIFAGTTGLLPLTGIVAPFLSFGKTGMIVFLALAAMIVRLAESGEARETTNELIDVRVGTLRLMGAVTLAVLAGIGVGFYLTVVKGPEISARGVVTMLQREAGDPNDRVINRHDPRLEQILGRIHRGPILDRLGRTIVGTDEQGNRVYPLGAAMGTLVGPEQAVVLRPEWMLERLLESRLKGLPELPDGPAVWMAKRTEEVPQGENAGIEGGTPAEHKAEVHQLKDEKRTAKGDKAKEKLAKGKDKKGAKVVVDDDDPEDLGEEMLFVVPSRQEKPEDRARAEEMAPDRELRLLPLPAPDYRPLVWLLHLHPEAREEQIQKMSADMQSRAVKLTIDAELQKDVASILVGAAKKGKAAAAVVMDVTTGQVLARAQVPDFDPGDPKFKKKLLDPDFIQDKKTVGIYGPWPDKTGQYGLFQGGSAAKLFTSLAAAQSGHLQPSQGCVEAEQPVFACVSRDGQGPFFTRPGWYKAVHDHFLDSPHGQVDLTKGLEKSCNVYFGQLGLAIGPDAFTKLWSSGVEMGWGGSFNPGKAGSRELALTGFGQGAMIMSVLQIARIATTIADGGVYKKCPASMELGGQCTQKKILDDPKLVSPILSGLAKVVQSGTAAGLQKPPGLVMYGKTGTADMYAMKAEIPWGVPQGQYGTPNSWFVGIAEPPAKEPTDPAAPPDLGCAPSVPGRVVVAVVVPRGGMGSRTAGPAAMEIFAAVQARGYLPKPQAPAPAAPGQPAAPSQPGQPQAPRALPTPKPSPPPLPTGFVPTPRPAASGMPAAAPRPAASGVPAPVAPAARPAQGVVSPAPAAAPPTTVPASPRP